MAEIGGTRQEETLSDVFIALQHQQQLEKTTQLARVYSDHEYIYQAEKETVCRGEDWESNWKDTKHDSWEDCVDKDMMSFSLSRNGARLGRDQWRINEQMVKVNV